MKNTTINLLSICIILIATGCSSTPLSPAVNPPQVVTNTGDVLCRAVVAGLTYVDPAAYGGWNGACPGCDIDADVMAMLFKEHGVQVSLHHNANATQSKLTEAAREAWKDMGEGDLFIFYVSGHGGQIADTSGDEEDAQDETLCLWDGQMSDDYLKEMWEEIPDGVRVLFVTDSCNSGSNYKARSFKRTIPRNYNGSLIHYGGCDDGESSYGGDQGGVFTTALIDAWVDGITYIEWFNSAAALMPRNQTPIYAEHGNVTDSFRNGEALK